METLEVYLNGRKAGRLVDDNGKMSFAYIREYLETDGREPISFSIPLRAEAFAHGEIEAFLSNLLPDDIIRTRIADVLQFPRDGSVEGGERLGVGEILFRDGKPRLRLGEERFGRHKLRLCRLFRENRLLEVPLGDAARADDLGHPQPVGRGLLQRRLRLRDGGLRHRDFILGGPDRVDEVGTVDAEKRRAGFHVRASGRTTRVRGRAVQTRPEGGCSS